MAIKLKCPNAVCGRLLTVPEAAAGKNGKCPACGTIIKVPVPAPVPRPAAPSTANDPGFLRMGDEPAPSAAANKPAAKTALPPAKPPEVKAVPKKPGATQVGRRPPVVDDIEELEEVETVDVAEPAPPKPASSRSKPQEIDDDPEVVEDDEDAEPAPRKTRSKRPRDVDDEVDALEDDEDDSPPRRRRPRLPRSGRRKTSLSDPALVASMGAGVVALILVAVAPFLSWVHVSASVTVNGVKTTVGGEEFQKAPGGGGLAPGKMSLIDGWEGKAMLGVSATLAVLIGVSLLLLFTAGSDVAGLMATLSGTAAACWGIACMLWVIGIMWKCYAVSAKMHSFMNKAKELSKGFAIQGAPNVDSSFSMYPSLGAWLALMASIAIIALFCSLVVRRSQPIWLAIGAGVGALAGILLVTLNARPWDTGPALPF